MTRVEKFTVTITRDDGYRKEYKKIIGFEPGEYAYMFTDADGWRYVVPYGSEVYEIAVQPTGTIEMEGVDSDEV
jgi:hypothetical protein